VAIDKNKIIEAATKYVQKGQYDKAIKEYTKLLEVDPKDARIQQKLGELYQKKNENNLAADCFLKVAESYSADGFFLKAVAVYKQVLKLNPALVDVNLRLAELHQQLGLMSDAMAQYQLVVNHYDKIGNTRASLDTLRKMVDLDPDNIASRIKLAELYARESMNPEAIAEFQHAAEYLKRNNRVDDYIKVAERLVFLDPGNIELTRELASIYLAKQDTKRALAKLQLCFKADPKDVETLSMLAQAFKDLGQVSKTVSVYKELARIYDEQDKVDEEREVWKKISQLAPDDPDARARFAPPPQAAPAAPSQPAAAVQAAQPAAPTRAAATPAASPTGAKASPEQVSKLLTETDVYVKYGLHEKALEHLKKVFAVDPSCIEAYEKAFNLYSASGNNPAAIESLAQAIRLSIAKGDLERARTNLQTLCEKDPTHSEIQGFLEKVGGLAPAEEVAEIGDDAIIVEAAEEMIEVAPEPPQVDLALETAAESVEEEVVDEPLIEAPVDSDDEALALAAQSLESGTGEEELIAEASPEEELIAAPPVDDDQLALDVAAAEPLEEVVEFPSAEVPFDPTAEAPFEAGVATTDALPEDEIDPHEEATRVAFLPSLLAAQQGQDAAQTPASAASWENDEGNEDVTAVLPTLIGTQPQQPMDPSLQAAADELTNALAAAPAAEVLASPEGDVLASPEGDVLAPPPIERFVTEPDPQLLQPPAEELVEAPQVDFSEPEPLLPPEEPPQEPLQAVVPEPPSTVEEAVEEPAVAAAPAAEAPAVEAPVTAAPAAEEEEPAGDELDEAAFFIEQGVLDEAREILETVQLAYPKSARAKVLMAQLEAKERGEEAPAPAPSPAAEAAASAPGAAPAPAATQDLAFDLASELANEDFGDLGADAGGPPEDFQYSFQDVFSEFKKGVEKIVRPEDVDTHYDLGIAYKEMGLVEDAIGEFEQAVSAAAGKKKEVECLMMIGLCRLERGESSAAVEAFVRGLKCAALTPESSKALHFELGSALEKAGDLPRALKHLAAVERLDPRYREVHAIVARIRAQGVQEHVEPEEVTERSVSKARPRPQAHAMTSRATPAGGSARATPAGGLKTPTPAGGTARTTPAGGSARAKTPAGGSARATPAGGSALNHSAKPAATAAKPVAGGAQPKKGRNIGYV
jgi:tetratricopeptide (TPR) repeat protein